MIWRYTESFRYRWTNSSWLCAIVVGERQVLQGLCNNTIIIILTKSLVVVGTSETAV